ncbi:hypothetical protein ACLB2K_030396 [Fragaria x ananassa]
MLLALSKALGSAGRVLLILCNLAIYGEGRSAMLDSNAVECLVGMLRRDELDSKSMRENCVAALYTLSHIDELTGAGEGGEGGGGVE